MPKPPGFTGRLQRKKTLNRTPNPNESRMIHDELSDSLAKALHVTGAMEQCSCHLLVKRVGMTRAGLVCGEPL